MADTLSPRMKTLARNLRKDMTPPEIKLWHELRKFKEISIHFRKQVPMGRYIVDFACHSKKLIIELDGDSHGYDQQRASDDKRDEWLRGQGYRVMRIWNNELYDNLDGVMDEIYRHVENDDSDTATHPTPSPSPSRGGEQKENPPSSVAGGEQVNASTLPPSPPWGGIEGGGSLKNNEGQAARIRKTSRRQTRG